MKLLLVFALSAALAVCFAKSSPRKVIAEANNDFGMDLFQSIRSIPGNLIVSPFSASSLLSLTYLGAKRCTAYQMRKVLHLPRNRATVKKGYDAIMNWMQDSDKVTFWFVNKQYLKNHTIVSQDFQDIATKHFLTRIKIMDFGNHPNETGDAINKWVSQQLHGTIKTILHKNSIKPNMEYMLLSALYYKGEWQKKFRSTTLMPFYVSKNQERQVKMMNMDDTFSYTRLEAFAASVLEIPYKEHNTSMILMLPDDVEGLPHLEEQLPQMNFSGILKNMTIQHVKVSLPKFRIEKEFDMKSILQEMGIKRVFTDKANLSLISKSVPLKVDEVMQQAVIDVSENATVAVYATHDSIVKRSPSSKPAFNANHPFLFFIVGIEDCIIFMGRLANPEY